MKKLAFIVALPVTASAFSLFLWSKMMEAFDDMLAPLDEPLTSPYADLGVNPPRLPARTITESTGESQRKFDRVMWDYYMEQQFNEDG